MFWFENNPWVTVLLLLFAIAAIFVIIDKSCSPSPENKLIAGILGVVVAVTLFVCLCVNCNGKSPNTYTCPSCEKSCSEDYNFCPNCGALQNN